MDEIFAKQKTVIELEKIKQERVGQLPMRTRRIPKQTKLMTFLLSLILLSSLLLTRCNVLTPTTIKFIRTVQVTPDDQFLTGSFARINYVPATDHFVVTFGTKASTEPNVTLGAGYAYKEYTVEMQETGKTGFLIWYPNSSEAGDSGSVMVNNTYYCAFVSQNPSDPYGWRVIKYDAVNWTRQKELYVLLPPNEGNLDPMVAYINGQLDISDQFNPSGIFQEGNSTNHHFFTADLQPTGMINLANTPHTTGSSIIFVDGVYYFVSANNFFGDLVLMKYDIDWNYLGMKPLIQQAHFSTGMAYDGKYFYVAYMDTSERTPSTFFPLYPNVHLAVFDRNWNLVHDEIVTNFTREGDKKGGRPWVILHGNRLYVSYDVDTVNKTNEEEELKWQAYVSIYEISQLTQGEAWWPWPILAAGIVIVAVIAVTYILLKKRGRRTNQEDKKMKSPRHSPLHLAWHIQFLRLHGVHDGPQGQHLPRHPNEGA